MMIDKYSKKYYDVLMNSDLPDDEFTPDDSDYIMGSLCIENDKVIGICQLMDFTHFNNINIFVVPEFRRHGIATALLYHFDSLIKMMPNDSDCRVLTALITPSNTKSVDLFYNSGYTYLYYSKRFNIDLWQKDLRENNDQDL